MESLPIFHNNAAWQLQLSDNTYVLHDNFSLEITSDCQRQGEIIICRPDVTFQPNLHYCIHGILFNSTISHCTFERINGPANCFYKYLSDAGVLISHSKVLNVTKRRANDDSRRNILRNQHPLSPGMNFIANSNETVTSGYCNGFFFQTRKLVFI